MNDLLLVEVAQRIDQLIYEILSLRDGQFLSSLYQFKHILKIGATVPYSCTVQPAYRRSLHPRRLFRVRRYVDAYIPGEALSPKASKQFQY